MLLCSQVCWAKTIWLTNGKSYEGEVVSETDEAIKLDTGKGVLSIKKKFILEKKKSTDFAQEEKRVFDFKSIADLVINKKYTELEDLLNNYQKQYEEGVIDEDKIYYAFYIFNSPHPNYEKHINEWLEQFPESYSAFTARGMHYVATGWTKRGGKFINETSQEEVDGMSFYFKKATEDFSEALKRNQNLLLPYCYLIDIYKNFGYKKQKEQLIKRVLEFAPDSLLVRSFYLSSLLPRWGGSIAQMKAFIEEARHHYSENPKLKVLDGRIDAEKGDRLQTAKNDASAIKYYLQALKHGDYYYYNRQLGSSYMYLGQYNKAVEVLTKSLYQRPFHRNTLRNRGYCFYKLGKYEEALRDYYEILEVDPSDQDAIKRIRDVKRKKR